ncbi:hypothetical protein FIBSPDRAFT_899776 [Athelia psychrophila]|uniref:Uncharacterized protein n=1 Tax=Athelia psychrophila TaxID=1759441 RepID=A0A165ZCP4_9AGAM|nr:hypothetical protein FIBSPDRAFT_899776 [Fibularhizoctonia sp. CBS 109695]
MLLRVHWYKVELIIDNDEHTGSVVAVDSWDKHLGPGGVHIGEGGGGGVMGLGVESMRDLNQYLKSKLILLGNCRRLPSFRRSDSHWFLRRMACIVSNHSNPSWASIFLSFLLAAFLLSSYTRYCMGG